jgi:hypothetical protein
MISLQTTLKNSLHISVSDFVSTVIIFMMLLIANTTSFLRLIVKVLLLETITRQIQLKLKIYLIIAGLQMFIRKLLMMALTMKRETTHSQYQVEEFYLLETILQQQPEKL